MATNTPPGWFPDHSDPNQLRWWDGEAWTSNTAPKPATTASGDDYATAAPLAQAAAPVPSSKPKRPWYFRWWAISLAVVVVLAIIGSFAPDDAKPAATGSAGADDTSQATAETDEAPTSVTASPTPVSEPEPEPEPADTDGDGTNDEDDVRPKDPEVQTEDDIDTDGDGVADYQDDFPKDAEYSKDSDGDSVPDRFDAFPKDPEYSKDTDSDGVADAKDAFPSDPSKSDISLAMENALSSAEDYLDFSAFSRLGLIDQLSSEYGSGFRLDDATWAVDQLNVDWRQQAVRAAKEYLDFSSFSRQGLIDQLSSPYGSQFTVEEATYAVNTIGL